MSKLHKNSHMMWLAQCRPRPVFSPADSTRPFTKASLQTNKTIAGDMPESSVLNLISGKW